MYTALAVTENMSINRFKKRKFEKELISERGNFRKGACSSFQGANKTFRFTASKNT